MIRFNLHETNENLNEFFFVPPQKKRKEIFLVLVPMYLYTYIFVSILNFPFLFFLMRSLNCWIFPFVLYWFFFFFMSVCGVNMFFFLSRIIPRRIEISFFPAKTISLIDFRLKTTPAEPLICFAIRVEHLNFVRDQMIPLNEIESKRNNFHPNIKR